MLKKIVPGIVAVSAVFSTTVLPSMAGDDTACSVVCFPFKVVGSSLSMVLGVPLGIAKGGVEGSIKTTKMAAKAMGNEDGDLQLAAGSVVAGPVGAVGGAAYGAVAGAIHGAKTGYDKPFSGESFKFKED